MEELESNWKESRREKGQCCLLAASILLNAFPDAHANDSGEDLLFENPNHQYNLESDEDGDLESNGDGQDSEREGQSGDELGVVYTTVPPNSNDE